MEIIFIESMFLQLLPYLQLEIDYTSSVQMVINYYNFTQLFEKTANVGFKPCGDII